MVSLILLGQSCLFFRSKGYGYCLTNRPQKNFLEKEVKKISKFAGEFFDENAQCELVFGQAGRNPFQRLPPTPFPDMPRQQITERLLENHFNKLTILQ